jgi:hypothetical protein
MTRSGGRTPVLQLLASAAFTLDETGKHDVVEAGHSRQFSFPGSFRAIAMSSASELTLRAALKDVPSGFHRPGFIPDNLDKRHWVETHYEASAGRQ